MSNLVPGIVKIEPPEIDGILTPDLHGVEPQEDNSITKTKKDRKIKQKTRRTRPKKIIKIVKPEKDLDDTAQNQKDDESKDETLSSHAKAVKRKSKYILNVKTNKPKVIVTEVLSESNTDAKSKKAMDEMAEIERLKEKLEKVKYVPKKPCPLCKEVGLFKGEVRNCIIILP